MGANAQTKVPTFAIGEVLTAANTNLLSNGIGVFSGTATRDAAFGGSGEKVLAEGQFAYLEDTNTTQYYDGAAWQSVGSTPGLVTIVAPTAFSAVTSFSLPASTFTTTYTHYIVNVSSIPTASGEVRARMRIGGADNTASSYTYINGGADYLGAFRYIVGDALNTWRMPDAATGGWRTDVSMVVMNPRQSVWTSINFQQMGFSGNLCSFASSMTFRDNTAFDSMTITAQNGTFTGSYAVYAYNVS